MAPSCLHNTAMEIRPFRDSDAPLLVALAASCARGETDFVLNPYWETEDELRCEFERFGIEPEEHVLVADAGDGQVQGLAGFLRRPDASAAGMFCPIVKRDERGRGVGGELLRATQRLGVERLGIRLMTAGIGTRNRAGYSLLTSHGFRPMGQAFLMRCDARPSAPAPPIEGITLAEGSLEDADDILDTLGVAAGHHQRQWLAAADDGLQHHLVAAQQSVLGQLELAEAIVPIGVGPREVEHQLGSIQRQLRQRVGQGLQISFVFRAVWQRDVEVAARFVEGEVPLAVHREGEHAIVIG